MGRGVTITGKNDVKYIFRSTSRKIGESVLILTGISKKLSNKDNHVVRFFEKNIVMIGTNDVKMFFRSTCRRIGESVLVLIGFSKELSYKSNCNIRFLKHIVIMGTNDVKVLKYKGTISN